MGNNQPGTGESTGSMLAALAKYAPMAISAINSTLPGSAEAQYQIDKTYYPKYYELDRQNQLQGSQNELDIARGTGSELVDAANMLQEKTDPEYYRNRAAVGGAIDKLLASYGDGGLSPTDERSVAQGLAREGPVTPSAMQTVHNAEAYADKGAQRKQEFANAILQASTALPTLKSGLPGFEVATRRAISPLPANSSTAIGTNFGFANNTLNQIGANQRQQNSMKKTVLDQVEQGTRAFSNVASGVGSII